MIPFRRHGNTSKKQVILTDQILSCVASVSDGWMEESSKTLSASCLKESTLLKNLLSFFIFIFIHLSLLYKSRDDVRTISELLDGDSHLRN